MCLLMELNNLLQIDNRLSEQILFCVDRLTNITSKQLYDTQFLRKMADCLVSLLDCQIQRLWVNGPGPTPKILIGYLSVLETVVPCQSPSVGSDRLGRDFTINCLSTKSYSVALNSMRVLHLSRGQSCKVFSL